MRNVPLIGRRLDSLFKAHVLTEDWRIDYYEECPYSALGWRSPAEFARAQIGDHQPSLA